MSSTFFNLGDGSRLHYQSWKPSKPVNSLRPTLVFLHYWGGSIRTWRKVIGLIKEDYFTVAIDLPGWGRSTVSPQADRLTIATQAASIWSLLDSLPQEIRTRGFVLVGHSMGAKVSLAVAALAAGRRSETSLPVAIAGMVLVAPAPPSPLVFPPEIQKQQRQAYSSAESVAWTVSHVLSRQENLSDEDVAIIIEDSLAGSEKAKEAWPLWGQGEAVEVPEGLEMKIAILAGELDVVETRERVETEVAAPLRKMGYEVSFRALDGVKHLIPLEEPIAVVESIRSIVN